MRQITDSEYVQHLKNIEVYGYTVVKSFLSANLVGILKSLVIDCHQKSAFNSYVGVPQRDAGDKILYNLQNKDKLFIDILCDQFIRSLLIKKLNDEFYRFLPENAPNYILSYYNARSSGSALDLHIDSHIPVAGGYAWAMQVAFILEKQDQNNGCTVVVPGSHQSGRYTDRGLENVSPVITDPGDLVVWDSRLWHGTLENKSGASRWSLIATFTRWWLKQSMDMTRSLPDAIYQELSNEQKSILGFCSIPPVSESDRINTKTGYDSLLPHVSDYYC
jgi:ectoine hydroxylase-related dioxygenase (phytanoyl-CoA dioxygenase family)